MSNLRIRISINGIEVELEGDSKLVLGTLEDFRKNGIGAVASVSGSQQAVPARKEKQPEAMAETASATPKRRGRKPKSSVETTISEPKRRGRKPRVAASTETAAEPRRRGRKPVVKAESEVAAEPKRRGRKPKAKDETVTEPRRRGRKPGPKKEKPVTEPKKRGRPAKPAAEKKPVKREEQIDLSTPAADYDTAVAKSLPRNETEWLTLYAKRSMEVWKKTEFSKSDLLNRYKDSGRDDKSKRSNFYNQFNSAMKKGLFSQGSSNELFTLTDNGQRLLDKVLRRTEGAKMRK